MADVKGLPVRACTSTKSPRHFFILMETPNQKKTNWLMIWLTSILSAPLSLLLTAFSSFYLILSIAILSLNFTATFKLLNLEKSDQLAPSPLQKIVLCIWITLLGLFLILSMVFGGCLVLLQAADVSLR